MGFCRVTTALFLINGFKNSIPDNPFIQPVDNIKAYGQKAFVHNLGHAQLTGYAHDNNTDHLRPGELGSD